jgi:hypothetical protein
MGRSGGPLPVGALRPSGSVLFRARRTTNQFRYSIGLDWVIVRRVDLDTYNTREQQRQDLDAQRSMPWASQSNCISASGSPPPSGLEQPPQREIDLMRAASPNRATQEERSK